MKNRWKEADNATQHARCVSSLSAACARSSKGRAFIVCGLCLALVGVLFTLQPCTRPRLFLILGCATEVFVLAIERFIGRPARNFTPQAPAVSCKCVGAGACVFVLATERFVTRPAACSSTTRLRIQQKGRTWWLQAPVVRLLPHISHQCKWFCFTKLAICWCF